MTDAETKGRKLLSAVERILDDNDDLIGLVRRYRDGARSHSEDEAEVLEETSRQVIQHWSNLSAVSGGATAIPAILPGIGTLLALGGGALFDVALVLKFEVEMALALAYAHGYDISDPRERQIAFLLASVSTYDARTGRNFFVDVAEAEGVAIWNYAPRELSKLLASALAKLAFKQLSKSVARVVPLFGIGIGAGINKVLTERVGRRINAELDRRRATQTSEPEIPDDVVDAQVVRD
jgi:hypothetical protein